jgi:hypothetical protein
MGFNPIPQAQVIGQEGDIIADPTQQIRAAGRCMTGQQSQQHVPQCIDLVERGLPGEIGLE